MIKPCVTISLVPQARGGPFVYWGDLEESCRSAKRLGFEAVELFPPAQDAVAPGHLRRLLAENDLQLAAVGTGAGWVVGQLSLTAADRPAREAAKRFARAIIDFAGPFGAPAIIGSLQGRWAEPVERHAALGYLREALNQLGEHSSQYGVPLLYEPLNRYETNLINTMADGVALAESLAAANVRLVADLFHMNIEEANMAEAIRRAAGWIGHVHFVDSNRQAAGRGHTDFRLIAQALRAIDFHGYASAEALPIPDGDEAARQTIQTFRQCFA